MLCHLIIDNFILIDRLELDLNRGLTVITGETGSGKSIMIDALSLLLGDRADSSQVGNYRDKCDLSACFNISAMPVAKKWLMENELLDEGCNECIIRRYIQTDGKSRQMINGHPCTLTQLRDLVAHCITIHSQNQHQLLTKSSQQRLLLDQYGQNSSLLIQVRESYQAWSLKQKELEQLRQQQDNFEVQCDLLEYQLSEFNKLSLAPGEYEQLDQEQRQLANAEQLVSNCQHALSALSESEHHSSLSCLYTAQNHLQSIRKFSEQLTTSSELITSAIVHVEEAACALNSYLSKLEIDPERLLTIENRITKIHDLARKYHVPFEEVHSVAENLQNKLDHLKHSQLQLTNLEQEITRLKESYIQAAQKLHEQRCKAAQQLDKVIEHTISKLGMPKGRFETSVTWSPDHNTATGCDDIQFLISPNPGQGLQPLAKIASGGELSRIALAIYVATAQSSTLPILVFDEVDVGIGGGTAAIVGELLKTLGQTAQVICITHLPQVAAYGDQHLSVNKEVTGQTTVTQIKALTQKERVTEVARMLGGLNITKKTLAHAKELISAT